MKTLFFDVETTGLDPRRNSIVQLSGMIDIDGTVEEEFNILIRPQDGDEISEQALAVIGKTKSELLTYRSPYMGYQKLINIMSNYVDKFDRTDKFYPAGYNVRFDLDFLCEFFRRNRDNYVASWVNFRAIDAMQLVHWMDYQGKVSLDNYKLSTICNHFRIDIQAHDAMSDIKATRELVYLLKEKIKYEGVKV